jgi:hypothetical protein
MVGLAELVGMSFEICGVESVDHPRFRSPRSCKIIEGFIRRRREEHQAVRMLSFWSTLTGDTEEKPDLVVGDGFEKLCFPPQDRRCVAYGCDGMTHIVLAVPKGTLAIFPRFAPVDRRQPDEERLSREPAHQSAPEVSTDGSTPLEGMEQGVVVIEAWPLNVGVFSDEEVRLSRMKISTRGIAPERPAVVPDCLPGRQRQGIEEKLRHEGRVHGMGLAESGRRDIIEGGFVLRRDFVEEHERCPFIPSEGIRLRLPVHISERSRKTTELMFGPFVIVEHSGEFSGGFRHAGLLVLSHHQPVCLYSPIVKVVRCFTLLLKVSRPLVE